MARARKHDGIVFRRKGTPCWWIRYRDRTGTRRAEPAGTVDWKEAHKKLRERLQARDDNVLEIVRKGEELTLKQWGELFLETYSKPPLRTPKTHEANTRAVMHLNKTFGGHKLANISSDAIEGYLRYRLSQRVKRKTKAGIVERGVLTPSTVHQELRVLRRILNVAVRKRLLPANPCWGVELPDFRCIELHTAVVSGGARRRNADLGISNRVGHSTKHLLIDGGVRFDHDDRALLLWFWHRARRGSLPRLNEAVELGLSPALA